MRIATMRATVLVVLSVPAEGRRYLSARALRLPAVPDETPMVEQPHISPRTKGELLLQDIKIECENSG